MSIQHRFPIKKSSVVLEAEDFYLRFLQALPSLRPLLSVFFAVQIFQRAPDGSVHGFLISRLNSGAAKPELHLPDILYGLDRHSAHKHVVLPLKTGPQSAGALLQYIRRNPARHLQKGRRRPCPEQLFRCRTHLQPPLPLKLPAYPGTTDRIFIITYFPVLRNKNR